MAYERVDALTESQIRDLHALYQGEWWSSGRTLDEIRVMLDHCRPIMGFLDALGGPLVGFARVLTDRVYKAFIFDVIVHRDHRGRGLGEAILDGILTHPDLRKVQMIELYCRPELAPWYTRWGFTTDCAGCVLMRRMGAATS